MNPDGDAGNPRLLEIIRDEVRAAGPLPFSRFMELAQHHPQHGYYAAGDRRIGKQGDFFTASDVGRSFARCLARQITEFDRLSGPFDPFAILEFGAGRGLLASDLLDALRAEAPELWERVDYRMIDRSPAMRQTASRHAPRATAVAPGELERGHAGCAIAVELFDALPVHRVRRRNGRLLEVAVALDASGRLVECEIAPAAEVAAWAELQGAATQEGSEAEVALDASRTFDWIASFVERGLMIVVDYGDRAAALYSADRQRGTLLAYHRHSTNEGFLRRVGRQDLTAHVNFTALEQRAQHNGWDLLGLTTQDRFLVANGILEEFEQQDLSQSQDPERVKRRLQAMQLIHPEGMGRSFRFLLLSKGCVPPPRLAGTIDPFARS